MIKVIYLDTAKADLKDIMNYYTEICQRRSKNLPDGGVKVGHCSWRQNAVAPQGYFLRGAGGVKVA